MTEKTLFVFKTCGSLRMDMTKIYICMPKLLNSLPSLFDHHFTIHENLTFGGKSTTPTKSWTSIQHITDAFASIQDQHKKGITTHIKEIRAFQKYFETSYRPDDLSRTIHEALFL